MFKKLMLLTGLALLVAASALAADGEEKGLLDLSRGQLALGGNYEWFARTSDQSAELTGFEKEWTAGLYASWNLIPELDLIGFSKFGLDNHIINSAIGLRYTIWSGSK